ncbi:inactive peptidyl-prolyl cis-trans isomerase shutdown-like [Chironomus tepperi]|uniref:inactive peptidyl-prolyl cis-trans isomerase shutdown-like n=1 Tax=Chironomus tepperi TaxID=113505 RepID=UPI00391FA5AC
MNHSLIGESSQSQISDNESSFLINDLCNVIANQVRNSSDIEILSINNEELMFSLQDLDDETQLYYDIEKEQNVTIDDYVKMKFLEHPCANGSFIQYRNEKMKKVNGQIYKRIENPGYGPIIDLSMYKVVYEYSFFLENLVDPLDSSRFKKCLGTIDIKKSQFTLAGIQDCITTMKYKEQTLFWICHELMYGVLGVKPRIPEKADFLARIKIVKLFDSEGNEVKMKITKFEETMQSAAKAYSLAKTHFNKSDYTVAIAIYRKWINILEHTHLASDEQENEVKECLIKMYMNICVCYNKIENPQRTCLAMRELEKLTSIADNVKALYAKGRALMMLHHEPEAQKFFEAALKLEPKNERLLNKLEELKAIISSKKRHATQMNYLKVANEKGTTENREKQTIIDKFLNSLPD